MAYSPYSAKRDIWKLVGRGVAVAAVIGAIGVYVLGATGDRRLEPVTSAALDRGAPVISFLTQPLRVMRDAFSDMGAFLNVYEHNRKLREDIVLLNRWREVALRLEAENARLRALNNVSLAPKFDYVTAQVVGNSSSAFTQTVTINVGGAGGLRDGAAAMDGDGVVGRVISMGDNAARLLLLTDLASRAPVLIQPGDVRGILVGDNSASPKLEFLSQTEKLRPGQRVVTSNDGGLFPKGLPVGSIERVAKNDVRVQLAAQYDELEFVRLLLDRSDLTVPEGAVLIVGPEASEEESPEGEDAQAETDQADTAQ